MVSNGRQPCMRGIDSEQAGWDVRSTSHLQTGMAFTIPWLCCLSVTVVSSICVHRSDRHAPANFYWSPQHKQQQQQQCHPWRPDATTLPLPLPSTPCSIPPSLPTNCRAVKAHYPAPIIYDIVQRCIIVYLVCMLVSCVLCWCFYIFVSKLFVSF